MLVWAMALTGCATRTNMAFGSDVEQVSDSAAPVYLMAVTLKNVYRPSFQPKMIVAHVERLGAKDAGDRLNFEVDARAMDGWGGDIDGDGETYLLRMRLDAGQYTLVGFTSFARSFPINALFFTPLHATVEARASGVFYLGHVIATVRERQGDEFKAGPSIPLLDQAIAGASGGTFDVTVIDQLASDERVFRSRFRALEGVPIQKSTLPPFDRALAQRK